MAMEEWLRHLCLMPEAVNTVTVHSTTSTMAVPQSHSAEKCEDKSSPSSPPTTTISSTAALARIAEVASHAFLPNSSWKILHSEGPPDSALPQTGVSDSVRQQHYQTSILSQFTPSLNRGGFIIEAADFGVVALWAPPGAARPIRTAEQLDQMEREGKVLGALRARLTDEARVQFVDTKYGQDYYALALLASDTRRDKVQRGVRAVLMPVIERAGREGRVIWLLTSSVHAKGIYEHFGWQMVRQIRVGEFVEWCMILYPDRSAKAA
jgi:hypothetical protein